MVAALVAPVATGNCGGPAPGCNWLAACKAFTTLAASASVTVTVTTVAREQILLGAYPRERTLDKLGPGGGQPPWSSRPVAFSADACIRVISARQSPAPGLGDPT